MISRRRFLHSSAGAAAAVSAGGVAIMAIPSVAAPADPLLDLINRYKTEEDRLNAAGLTDDEMDAEIGYLNSLLDELRDWTEPATSAASAAVAMRFALEFMEHSCDGYEDAMIAAALGYLEGRASA